MTPSNIAIIRTDRLGDMVLTLPMFTALRERFPAAHLTLYARSYVRDLVEGLSCIDDVVYVDDVDVKTADHTPHFDLRACLVSRHIDAVFFPRATFGEVWAAFRAGVRVRVGTANRWYSFLYNRRIGEHRSRAEHHEAEYNVRMISHAFGPPEHTVHLVRPLAKPAPSQSIIVHPGSGNSAHQWPAEFFGETARRLEVETGLHVIVTGTASEKDLCAKVAAMCANATNACAAYTLEELMSVIGGARLLLANSTGTLHVAAALGTPVVGFYPNSPALSAQRWGPYTPNARVLVSKANDDMTTISVDDATRVAKELLVSNSQ